EAEAREPDGYEQLPRRNAARAHDGQLAMHGEIAEAQERADQRGRGQRREDRARDAQRDVGERHRERVVTVADVVELADELDRDRDGDEHGERREDAARDGADQVTAQQRHAGAATGGARTPKPLARASMSPARPSSRPWTHQRPSEAGMTSRSTQKRAMPSAFQYVTKIRSPIPSRA